MLPLFLLTAAGLLAQLPAARIQIDTDRVIGEVALKLYAAPSLIVSWLHHTGAFCYFSIQVWQPAKRHRRDRFGKALQFQRCSSPRSVARLRSTRLR